MKLAEALARRADLTTRIAELRGRALAAAQHQEGDEPVEDPTALVAAADGAADDLQALMVAINTTNLSTEIEGASRSPRPSRDGMCSACGTGSGSS